jgi:hypothetical protein
MVLLFHILTALGSLVAAGVLYVRPSVEGLRATYFLTASMLASGTYLVIRNMSHLLEACIMGLVLLSVILYATVTARNKLAHAQAKRDK